VKARVVFERNDAFDMQSGPYGYERVGFAIGDRVFWTGCAGSGMPGGTYEADKALAKQIVERWNASEPDIRVSAEKLASVVMEQCRIGESLEIVADSLEYALAKAQS